MKFNIGDKVQFLNDVGGGKVIKYIDEQTVLILNDDDFEIPVPINELIIDRVFDYEHTGQNVNSDLSASNEEDEDDFEKETDEIDIFLALVNGNNVSKLFLINDSNYNCFSNVAIQYGAFHIGYPNSLKANTKIEICTLKKSDISSIDSIALQIIFYKNKAYKLKPVISKILDTNVLKTEAISDNDFFDEKAAIISVFNESNIEKSSFPEISAEDIKQAMYTKEVDNKKLNKKANLKSSKPKEIREIDLHIHELLDKHSNMTPKEILDYQMESFRKEIKQAIADKVHKIVFIHGKGNGSLKSELRRELKHRYRKYQFQDASFQRYGFGATMVYLHK